MGDQMKNYEDHGTSTSSKFRRADSGLATHNRVRMMVWLSVGRKVWLNFDTVTKCYFKTCLKAPEDAVRWLETQQS